MPVTAIPVSQGLSYSIAPLANFPDGGMEMEVGLLDAIQDFEFDWGCLADSEPIKNSPTLADGAEKVRDAIAEFYQIAGKELIA